MPVVWWLGGLTVAQLIAVELVVGVGRVTFRPDVLDPPARRRADRALPTASARLKTAEAIALLAGPGLGGSLVQLLTAPVAVLADAASFVGSALLVGRVRAPERVGHVPSARRRLPSRSARGWP